MNIPQLGIFKSKSLKAIRQHQNQKQYKALRQHYLGPNCHRTYSCIHCRAHLANHDELISKLFQGNHGRAYLFNKVVNVGCRQAVERELLTGLHAVADIYCDSCEQTLGWKYEQAFVPSQKYKEGKYIIELVHLLKENHWDLTSYNSEQLLEEKGGKAATATTPTRTTAMRGRSNTFMNGTSHGTGFVAGAGTGSDSADPDDCDFDPYNSDKLSAIARPDYRSSFSINIGITDDTQAIDDGAEKHSDNHEGGAEKAAPPSADTKASADAEQEIRPQCLEGSTTAETSCNEATATTRETIRIDRDGAASQGAAP